MIKNSLFYLSFVFLVSCETGEIYKYKAKKHASNLVFDAATIYYGEIIQIRYNGDLIFRHKMDSAAGFSNAFQCYRKFTLPYTEKFSISITTSFKDKIYIDTTMAGTKGNLGYRLTLSRSFPPDWGEVYFEKGQIGPKKKLGYLPIDSSIRLAGFTRDTVYEGSSICDDDY